MQRLHRQLCAASSKHQATVSQASALATVRRCCKAEARCTQPSRGHADCSRSCSLHTASVCPGQTHELVAEARASTCTLSIAASAPRPGTFGCGLRRDGARIRAGRAHAGHIGNQDLLPRTRRQGSGPPAAFHRLMPARAHVRHGRAAAGGSVVWDACAGVRLGSQAGPSPEFVSGSGPRQSKQQILGTPNWSARLGRADRVERGPTGCCRAGDGAQRPFAAATAAVVGALRCLAPSALVGPPPPRHPPSTASRRVALLPVAPLPVAPPSEAPSRSAASSASHPPPPPRLRGHAAAS